MRRSLVLVHCLCVASLGCSSSPKSTSSTSGSANAAAGGSAGATHGSSGTTGHAAGSGAAASGAAASTATTGGATSRGASAGSNGAAGAGSGGSNAGTAAAGTSSGSSGPGLLVYQSGTYASGWTDANWASACPGSSSTASIGGQTAIEVDLTCGQYNGNFLINWNATQALATYSTIAFDLYVAQASDLQNLEINIQEGSNTSSAMAVPLTNYLSAPTAGAFNHVVVPIGPLLDTGTSSYLGFIFHYTSATGSIFYLNNVALGGGTTSTANTGTTGASGTTGAAGTTGASGTTGTPGTATFTIDLNAGPQRQFNPPAAPTPVSPYVYGVNSFAAWEMTTQWGLLRWGGDAFTDWNWTNNYSNSAADYCFWQGNQGGGTTLAGTISTGSPSIPADQAAGIASLVTVPILDWVSAAVNNNVYGAPGAQGAAGPCPASDCSGASSTRVNSGNLPLPTQDPTTTAFSPNRPRKGSAFCTCQPGATCSSGCTVDASGPVYEDELANYLATTYGGGGAPVFLMLDNEPNYWPSTHPEVWGDDAGSIGCNPSGSVAFDDIVSRDLTSAEAVKAAWPGAKVFGPVVAQDGIIYGGSYSDPHLPTPFGQYYLAQLAAASADAGQPLVDSFDVHYYTDGNSPSGAQCLQTPRLFWDPSFTAFSASTVDAIDFGWSGQNNYFDTSLYPRQMIPRLEGWIASAFQGNATAAPGLSISEYDMGCEDQIEGGVAEADLLGVFGREGLFAATMWPLTTVNNGSTLVNYPVAAFDLYRNYDGQGTAVGDTAVSALTSDVDNTSIYAFTHSNASADVDLVAINKSSSATTATITIANAPALSSATLYVLAGSTIGVTAAGGTAPAVTCAAGACTIAYTMPAVSATTLILR